MNCEQAREKLIDLAYDELDEPDRQAVDAHLAACAACRDELRQLLLARKALAMRRTGELPARYLQEALQERMQREALVAPPVRPPRQARRLVAAVGAIAAVLAIGIAVWVFLQKSATIARAETGPVQIKRVGVSLTILSEPERRAYIAAPQQARQAMYRYRYPGWQGMALVRDRRVVRRLKKGLSQVRFTDVPSAILPDTVRLRSVDDSRAMTILEQNYQYDLASAAAVLKRYVDKRITAVFKDGKTISGSLLSFDDGTLVVRPPNEGPRNISREALSAVGFEKLPEGLLTRPTLLWQLQNNAASEQQFEVAYLTGGLKWRADYVLKLRPAERPAGEKSEIPSPKPEIFDTADLVGYATVSNNSGVTFEQAQLKLLAGDVNLILPTPVILETRSFGFGGGGEQLQFQEKSFFEYHLYTLGRPTTIRNAETKQIEFVSGGGLKLKRGYVYDPKANPTAARVVGELKNSKANGLGKPLPKGVLRLYAPDAEGVQAYVAQTTIDHTPKDEKISLSWGYAFDISCSSKRFLDDPQEDYHRCTWKYDLRNHKDYDVTVTVIARIPKYTSWADCTLAGRSHPWHVREVGVVEIDVPVKSNAAAELTFKYGCKNTTGGGLKSPYDEKRQ